MPARASKPCRLMWIWGAGGAVLGTITGLMGRNAVLVCTDAVERTVHRHLEDQVRYLYPQDAELAETIAEIQRQEQQHLSYAVEQRPADGVLGRALGGIIVAATEALIWLSTRGDSARLAAELRT